MSETCEVSLIFKVFSKSESILNSTIFNNDFQIKIYEAGMLSKRWSSNICFEYAVCITAINQINKIQTSTLNWNKKFAQVVVFTAVAYR